MSRVWLCVAASVLGAMMRLPGNAQDAQKDPEKTVFELACAKVCANPIHGCNGCLISVAACSPTSLKQKSSVTWSTAGGEAWTVRFTGKSPCQRKSFGGQNAVCELTGAPGTYKYVAGISGCTRRIKGTFAVVQ
jgi:hypothetical protein